MQKENDYWYASWFDTPYYHILYKDRNYDEAADFMKNLTHFLKLEKEDKILDLACGKGRHSKYLNKLGYDVTGVDLSANSISYAKQYENKSLAFAVHDMCLPFPETFNAVFNLFTSFGYFETEEDNLRTIKAIKKELKPNGFGVIDFLNSTYIKNHLVEEDTKTINGITFHLKRAIKGGYIIKTISFVDNHKNYQFTEKVKALTLQDFEGYFEKANIKLMHYFGDYSLNKFDKNTSQRLILIFR